MREGPSSRQTVDRALYNPPSLYGGCGTPTTPSSNLVRAEPGAEPRWYDASRRRHRHQDGLSPHAPGEKGGVRHPPFFGRFGGTSLGPQSACCPPQLGVASQRWRHAWDDPPPPQYQGGVRSSSLRDLAGPPRWLLPSEGSRQPSCSPRTPRRNPSPLTGRQRNDEPVHGFLHGGARASRSGPDPPPIRGLSRVRAGRRRGFTSLPATHGCAGGEGAAALDSSHPPDGARASLCGRQRPPGPAHVPLVFGHRRQVGS